MDGIIDLSDNASSIDVGWSGLTLITYIMTGPSTLCDRTALSSISGANGQESLAVVTIFA